MLDSFDDVLRIARQNCNHPGSVFDRDYMADFATSLRCLGPSLSKSITGVGSASQIPGCTPHHQLAMLIAGDAIKQLDESRYRAWSDAVPGMGMMLRWERVLWRYCLCYTLGFLSARTSIKKSASAPSWSSILLDLKDYSPNDSFSLDFSERYLNGPLVSYATHKRLFPSDDSSSSPMVSLALADAYSFKPNTDNPLVVSLRRALKKHIIGNKGLQLPFWWAFAINHLFAHDDTVPPVPTHFSRYQSSPRDDELSEELNQSSASPDASSPSPSAPVEALCELSRRLFSEGHTRVNGPGADLHVTGGRLYAVHPSFFSKLASAMQKADVTENRIYDLFLESDLLARKVAPDQALEFFGFCPPEGAKKGKLVGSARMVMLSHNAPYRLLSPDFVLKDNPDVRRKDGVRQAGGEEPAMA